ncbi:MAG TPA: hypothetical protein VH165_07620 [Kofleriaceae bacterium]|nr:hypothetical protein [Kofleriaceae bacterium]
MLGLAGNAADAAPSDVSGIAWMFGVAVVASDAIPTLVFAIDDVATGHSTGYGAGELAYNASVGTAFVQIALHADDADELAIGAFGSAVHGALAMHGLATIAERRHWPVSTTLVAAGSLVSGAVFLPGVDGDGDGDGAGAGAGAGAESRSTGYRVAEVAVNAPLAAGYAYRAYVDCRAGHAGLAALAIAGGTVATELAIDGLHPTHRHLHALARTGLAPTLVDDGRDVALGIGVGRHL